MKRSVLSAVVVGVLLVAGSPVRAGSVDLVPDWASVVSAMGPVGDPAFAARDAAVAFDPLSGEFLVVWSGDDNTGDLVEGEFEVFGQRVGSDGSLVGSRVRVSAMGPNFDPEFGAFDPAVAFDPLSGEFLVVWRGDDNTGGLVEGEFEVFGQRVGSDGSLVGSRVRVSAMGPDGDPAFDAFFPAVAFDPLSGEFLVVWDGDDNTGGLVDNESEIFGQRVGSDGSLVGSRVRVSTMGPDGDAAFDAFDPAVAFDPLSGGFLVVWAGDDNTGGLVDDEAEIFGQRVASGGSLVGSRVRVSAMGPDGDPTFVGAGPAVAFSPLSGEFLVVWIGDDNTGGLVDDEFEIFGRRVGPGGSLVGSRVRVSAMGPDGDAEFDAFSPAVAFSPLSGEFVVVWRGDDNTGGLVDNEAEIFGQRVGPGGSLVGSRVRVSAMGPDGDPLFDAFDPAVAFDPSAGEFVVVWTGDDNTGGLVDEEFEIHGAGLLETVEAVSGYWMLESTGLTHGFGDATLAGNASAPANSAVDMAPTPSGGGFWIVDSSGVVYPFGDAPHLGNADNSVFEPGEQVTTIAAPPTGGGYWLFTDRGRVQAFGDAIDFGDVADLALAGPVIDSAATPSGVGYYMLGSDGGVFTFGDAAFAGSVPQVLPGETLDGPVVGLVPTPSNAGYWLVASDGGLFAFGDATFDGSIPEVLPGVTLNAPVNGMVAFGDGYLMVASDGGVFNFSNKVFHGSLGDMPPPNPIVAIAPLDLG